MNSAIQNVTLPLRASSWTYTGRAAMRQFLQLIRVWHQRRRQRRQLLTLPPEMLKDIGISRADAMREGGKAFWQR